jgi:hypothetical protein
MDYLPLSTVAGYPSAYPIVWSSWHCWYDLGIAICMAISLVCGLFMACLSPDQKAEKVTFWPSKDWFLLKLYEARM